MDMDMRKNASGYYDETAYKAMTTGPKAGEIWTHNTSGAYMLVVANVGGVYVTLRINDNARDANSLPVMVRTQMWVNPQFLGYCFSTMLGQFVKLANKDEFEAVKSGIAEALDLVAEEVTEEEEEEAVTSDDIEGIQAELEGVQKECEAVKKKLLISQENAKLYCKMYNELLDKVIGRVS